MNIVTKIKLACSKEAGFFMFGKEENFSIINNAINLDRYLYSEEKYRDLRHKLGWGDKKVILYVARMNHQKNPLFALYIMRELKQSMPNAVLVYVGTGELKEQVQQYILDNNLDNVILLGLRNDVNELMIAADLFILPSLFEGLPIVAVEAQAAGLPIILSENISIEAKLVNSTYFLPINDVFLWVNKIKKILEISGNKRFSDQLALSKAGYNIESVVKNIQKILVN